MRKRVILLFAILAASAARAAVAEERRLRSALDAVAHSTAAANVAIPVLKQHRRVVKVRHCANEDYAQLEPKSDRHSTDVCEEPWSATIVHA